MAQTSTYVSTGKPRKGGAIYRAPLETTLPTDATTTLAADYVQLGYVSEDGLTNTASIESDDVKAWGGDTVLALQTEKTDTWTFKLLEVLNVDVLKAVYGEDNVTGDLATGIHIESTSAEVEESVYVVDMIMRDGALKRIVIPDAKLSGLGDIVYKDDEAAGYEMTLTGMPVEGVTHHEYIIKGEES